MNQNFLYILPFNDGKHFKIGISSNGYSRINHLNKIYDINLNQAYIIHSVKNNVKMLETELLQIFDKDDCDKFDTDGYTEIRNIKYLDECLSFIQNKHIKLNYILTKFDTKIFNKITYSIKSNKPSNTSAKIRTNLNMTIIIDFMQNLEQLFDNCYNLEQTVKDGYTQYEFCLDKSFDIDNSKIPVIHLITDTRHIYDSALFGMIACETTFINKHITLFLTDISNEITHFKYNGDKFESNPETIQLLTSFKQILELKYQCEQIGNKDSFQTLLNNGTINSPSFLDTKEMTQNVSNYFKDYTTTCLKSDTEIDSYLIQEKRRESKLKKTLTQICNNN